MNKEEGDIGIPMTDSCWCCVWQKQTQYYKAISLQLNTNKFN